MLKFILRKILNAVITIFIIITCSFFLINLLYGDPFIGNKALDAETIHNLQHMYGFDQSIFLRYWHFLKGLINFDFGYSYANIGIPIKDLILPNIPHTGLRLSLEYCSMVLTVVLTLGIMIGIISVVNNGVLDKILNFITVLGFSVPLVIIAPLLIQFFGVKLKWFPIFQWNFDFQHLFLPVLALSINILCYVSQVEKMNLSDVLNSKFIKMAKAKGLSRRHIILKHALKPALIPVIGYLSSIISSILTGTVVIERLFGMPGIGNLTVNAALSHDYPLMLAIIIIFSTIFTLSNVIVDILYVLIDPKVQVE